MFQGVAGCRPHRVTWSTVPGTRLTHAVSARKWPLCLGACTHYMGRQGSALISSTISCVISAAPDNICGTMSECVTTWLFLHLSSFLEWSHVHHLVCSTHALSHQCVSQSSTCTTAHICIIPVSILNEQPQPGFTGLCVILIIKIILLTNKMFLLKFLFNIGMVTQLHYICVL